MNNTAKNYLTTSKPTSIMNRKSPLEKEFDEMAKTLLTSTNDLMGLDLLESGPFWAKNEKYPPHDVISLGENKYRIDIALAGFKRDDINVTVTDDTLEVSADTAEKNESSSDKNYYLHNESSDTNYLHKGIAKRSFKLKFRMPQYGEVENCELTNGILSVTINKNIPEEKLPKRIEIK
jgi:molecular chaperone IbpA